MSTILGSHSDIIKYEDIVEDTKSFIKGHKMSKLFSNKPFYQIKE